jgi:glycosyltransferase 2 family protein
MLLSLRSARGRSLAANREYVWHSVTRDEHLKPKTKIDFFERELMMAGSSSIPVVGSRKTPQPLLSARQLLTLGITVFTCAMMFLQWRSWQSFDWSAFLSETRGLRWSPLAIAVGLSLLTFPLRAWRWQVFLRPVRNARLSDVLSPTLIGFTGLALLGRPGELVRPYMIARRTNLTMASQMGVWMVERIFDMGAFAVMAVVAFVFATGLPDLRQFRVAAWITAAIIVAMAVASILVCKWRSSMFAFLDSVIASRYPASRSCFRRMEAFAEGLNTVKDTASFIELSLLSLSIWLITAFAYVETLHAYPALRASSFSAAMLLMGFSMIGGLVQLPAVGGGAQLATIVAMVDILGIPRELAVSAGILLWLVSFHAVTPIGLLLARRAHVSFKPAPTEEEKVSRERQEDRAIPVEALAQNPCYQESGTA